MPSGIPARLDYLLGILLWGISSSITARSWKVGEPSKNGKLAVVRAELEAYPESKILIPGELAGLVSVLGGTSQVAARIGASEAFVRQNMARFPRRNDPDVLG